MQNSVHLQKIPNFNEIPYNAGVVSAMSFVRKICNAGLSIRKKNNIKARIPLAYISIIGDCAQIQNNQSLIEIIKDEINVKNVILTSNFNAFNVKKTIQLEASLIAKRLGKNFQTILQSAKSGHFTQIENEIEINGFRIFENEYEINLALETAEENYTSIEGRYLVILDTTITQALQNEGIARDFIRAVQNARKDANFNIVDHIGINIISKSKEINNAINQNIEYIKNQVLAESIGFESKEFTSKEINNATIYTTFTPEVQFAITKQ